jgi:hypothetical protein
MTPLHRYWFKLAEVKPLNSLPLGCGVTAYHRDDALDILRRTVFRRHGVFDVLDVIDDVDVSTLDQNHVLPNVEAPVWRGVAPGVHWPGVLKAAPFLAQKVFVHEYEFKTRTRVSAEASQERLGARIARAEPRRIEPAPRASVYVLRKRDGHTYCSVDPR